LRLFVLFIRFSLNTEMSPTLMIIYYAAKTNIYILYYWDRLISIQNPFIQSLFPFLIVFGFIFFSR